MRLDKSECSQVGFRPSRDSLQASWFPSKVTQLISSPPCPSGKGRGAEEESGLKSSSYYGQQHALLHLASLPYAWASHSSLPSAPPPNKIENEGEKRQIRDSLVSNPCESYSLSVSVKYSGLLKLVRYKTNRHLHLWNCHSIHTGTNLTVNSSRISRSDV